MGLDAYVYKNFERLPQKIRDLAKIVDPLSGEIVFKDEATEQSHSFNFHAIEVRLGNIWSIGELRAELAQNYPGQCPVILKRVLYSGSHTGDWIPKEELAMLEDELRRLESALSQIREQEVQRELREFIGSMKTLLATAKTEGTTIGF